MKSKAFKLKQIPNFAIRKVASSKGSPIRVIPEHRLAYST